MSIKKYNEKRDFNKTKEPIGKINKSSKKLKFVVQHHMARKEHYDLRLEFNGTLKSWAVPKGPSYNPKDKRLAIQVEDHPISYRNFEGTIPKGEYGGGTVMVWDEGTWEATEYFDKKFTSGTIKFILKGKRLKGAWTLIHLKDNNWLLLKEQDEYSDFIDIKRFNRSVKTKRTMNEISMNEKLSDSIYEIESIEITHPDKIIFENPSVTKEDIVKYYQKVAPRMLPFLKNRLISTVRCPDGLKGEKFFKKHFEDVNSCLGNVVLNKNEDYYYIKDVSGLISEVQMNSFEFHIWGCNINNLNRPDVMVFDLDPDEGMDIIKVREGVKDLKSILDDFSLTSFLKTSGGKGYHIVVPFKTKYTWAKFSKVASDIAKLMEAKWPDKYVSNMRKNKRKGKIFIDWVRNTKKATSVAPYSLRLRKKATVSMPISWGELDKIKPDEITIEKAIKRLKRKDPWEGFFDVN